MNDLISIIVPIYNVEKYLKECLNSILKQTYKNIEIILVDDGSKDNCGKICDEYEKKDNRIIVIHKKNGGLSDARNAGIKIARGKYLSFIDSDDYVSEEFIEKLYNAVIKNNTKISQCGIHRIKDNKEEIKRIGYEKDVIISGREMIKAQYTNRGTENVVVWNKLYLRELFSDLEFPYGKIHEDEFTTYKILYNIDNVAIINDYLYYYRLTDNSIMGRKFNEKRLDVLDAFDERLLFFKSTNDVELYNETIILYLDTLIQFYYNAKKNICDNYNTKKQLQKRFQEIYKANKDNKTISNKKKIKYWIFFNNANLLYYLKCIKQRGKESE